MKAAFIALALLALAACQSAPKPLPEVEYAREVSTK